MNHELKCEKKYFDQTLEGFKPFEIRFAGDRDFQEGETVTLHCFTGDYSDGRKLTATIGYVCNYEQKDDYVVFGLLNIQRLS